MIQLPSFPGAALLLEHMLVQVLKQLSLPDSAGTSSSNTKRDTGFVVYLLDLLGMVCTGLRKIILTAEREEHSAQSFFLSPDMKIALKKKVDTLKQGWLATNRSHGSLKNKKGSRGSKGSSTPEAEDTLDVGIALGALLEVTASTVDVLCDTPAVMGHDGEEALFSTALSALPSPVTILEQLPDCEDILRHEQF